MLTLTLNPKLSLTCICTLIRLLPIYFDIDRDDCERVFKKQGAIGMLRGRFFTYLLDKIRTELISSVHFT